VASRINSVAVACRLSGFFAIALATTSSSCTGSSGRVSLTLGGGDSRCAYITAISLERGNGTQPTRHSYRTAPSE
jgi:BNR repeat-containing family member